MGTDETDISELVEKAKIVAEATGRDEQEVLADLLDDGIVNLSNEEAKGKDLVTQLKGSGRTHYYCSIYQQRSFRKQGSQWRRKHNRSEG